MRYRVWASMGLLCLATSQAGCASGLDFDHVSSGHRAADTSVPEPDAGLAEPIIRMASTSTPSDVHNPDSAVADGGLIASSPDAHAGPDADAADTGSYVEAGASSADSSVDAGSSDSSALPADPTQFSCASLSPEPFFCDDFESLPLSSHWSFVAVDPPEPLAGGTLAIDSNAALAGSNSLLVEVNEGLSGCGDCIGVRSELTLPNLQGATKLIAELDLRVELVDPIVGRRLTLFQVWWGSPEAGFTQHAIQLESSGGSLWMAFIEIARDGQAAGTTEPPIATQIEHQWEPTPVLSEWVHVVYELDVLDATGTGNLASLTVGDVVLFDGPLSFPLRNAKAQLELGVPWVDTSSFAEQDTTNRWRIRYDNMLVRYEPR